MKYRLVIENTRDLVIHEYPECELVAKNRGVARLRFDRAPEYSMYPEHPDYYIFSVFPDGEVVRYDYTWVRWVDDEDDLFNYEGYIFEDSATFKGILCKRV